MDKLTLENLELLERLGYFYEKNTRKFWAVNHELYMDLALMHCNDLVRVITVIINFEKELAFNNGKSSIQEKIKEALGINT